MRVKQASVLWLFFLLPSFSKFKTPVIRRSAGWAGWACSDIRFLLPPRGLWLQYKEHGFSSITYLVFLSYLMKDPMITGNITHCHCWACPDTSERSFPCLRQSCCKQEYLSEQWWHLELFNFVIATEGERLASIITGWFFVVLLLLVCFFICFKIWVILFKHVPWKRSNSVLFRDTQNGSNKCCW